MSTWQSIPTIRKRQRVAPLFPPLSWPAVMEVPVFGRSRPEGKVLEAVGVFEAVKQHGKYETGQVRVDSSAAVQACTHLHPILP